MASLLAGVLGTGPRAAAQSPQEAALPASGLSYGIHATYLPQSREIRGRQVLRFRNPATRSLSRLPLHLYLNGFGHTATTWARGAAAIRRFDPDALLTDFPDPWGFMRVDSVRSCGSEPQAAVAWARGQAAPPQGGSEVALAYIQPDDGNPLDRSLAEARLGTPLAPGQQLCLALSFTARLPRPIARTGAVRDYVHAAQWFPKLGVLEPPGHHGRSDFGWGARQFHGPPEFYADFADFEVTVDLPRGYTVVGTGGAQPQKGAPTGRIRKRFVQRAVHDFSWVAGTALHLETHRHQPRGEGPPIAITYAVPTRDRSLIPRLRHAAEHAFDLLGQRVGPYPYRTMAIVQPPFPARRTAGMEYPTLVSGFTSLPLWHWPTLSKVRLLESTLVHELAHNYFYGLVASDEQREAFLDEGFTSYWEQVILDSLADGDPSWYALFGHPIDPTHIVRRGLASRRVGLNEAPVRTPSDLFLPGTHAAQIYSRPQLILQTAARRFGEPQVDRLFRTYFRRFRFQHATTEDFFATARQVGPQPLAAFLEEAFYARSPPDYAVQRATSQRWRAPLGHVWNPSAKGPDELVTPATQAHASRAGVGFDDSARDTTEGVQVEITDPGHTGGAQPTAGSRTRQRWARRTERSKGWEGDGDAYVTTVRVSGPGYRHLPVSVRFRFADGVTVEERWDGRATWRGYRFVRQAPLAWVWIDPQDELAVEVNPDNNRLRVHRDYRRADPWARFLTATAQWLAALMGLWL